MGIVAVYQLPGTTVNRSKNERTGFRGITVTQFYRIEMAAKDEVPVEHPDFPVIGDTIDYDGFTLQCKENPITGQDPQYRKFFYASATFDNFGDAGDKDITEQFPEKTWRSVMFREMVDDAEFLGVFDEEHTEIAGLVPNGIVIGEKTPIVNSALVPRPKERTIYGRKFRIVQYFKDFNSNWEDYQGKYNEDTFTVTQSDREGEKWSFTFQPRTCQMEDVEISEERLDNGIIYFRVVFNFVQHPKTWVHYEVDIGRKYRFFVGQFKKDGTTFSQSDLDSLNNGEPGYQEFTTKVLDGSGNDTGKLATISEPIKLNGRGHEFAVDNGAGSLAETYFMGFLTDAEKPFSILNM